MFTRHVLLSRFLVSTLVVNSPQDDNIEIMQVLHHQADCNIPAYRAASFCPDASDFTHLGCKSSAKLSRLAMHDALGYENNKPVWGLSCPLTSDPLSDCPGC